MSRQDRLALAFLALHPDRSRALRDRWGGASGAVAAVRRGRVRALDATRLANPCQVERALARSRVDVVLLGEPGYPERLAAIEDPPDVLFVKGAIPDSPMVAVVGTRSCTSYGRGLARSFGAAVASAGWCLVSGLARGIDGEAHRGALEAGGPSVGVMGSGPNVIYPREHDGMIKDLESSGAIVSEYPPGTPPHAWRFPPRNRIISGLGAVVVVVEAAERGGALVTAARAIEQGRELFAVPGDVGRSSSAGCNLLIRDGALPVMGPEDLVEALSVVLGPPRAVLRFKLPPSGVTLDQLADRLGIAGSALLAWLGRGEAAGVLERREDRVYPTGR